MTLSERQNIFTKYFALGCLSTGDLNEKLELYYLVCFLTHKVRKKEQNDNISSLSVIERIIGRSVDTNTLSDSYDVMLTGLSILCDDLLYMIKDVKTPEGFTSASEIANRLKYLLEQWLPF